VNRKSNAVALFLAAAASNAALSSASAAVAVDISAIVGSRVSEVRPDIITAGTRPSGGAESADTDRTDAQPGGGAGTDEECLSDMDHNGSVNYIDVTTYLALFFAGDKAADMDGHEGLSWQDIFAFLDSYLTGPCAEKL
jgi:hypothetical protein